MLASFVFFVALLSLSSLLGLARGEVSDEKLKEWLTRVSERRCLHVGRQATHLLLLGSQRCRGAKRTQELHAPARQRGALVEFPFWLWRKLKRSKRAQAKHQPVVVNDGLTKDGSKIKLRVVVRGETEDLDKTHPMTEAHHIEAVFVTDYQNNVLFAHEFDPKVDNKAEASFELPNEDRMIVAYEFCNLHGLYKGPAFPLRKTEAGKQEL